MQAVNPYQPPVAAAAQAVPDSSPSFFASLVPATLAIGLALLVWIVLVSTFDRIIPRDFSMPMWSLTLFLASSLSILAVNRVWRTATNPLAFAIVFTLFSVVFLVAEGDTSNGTNYWNMAFVYGTLLTLPFAAYILARYGWYGIHANARNQDSG